MSLTPLPRDSFHIHNHDPNDCITLPHLWIPLPHSSSFLLTPFPLTPLKLHSPHIRLIISPPALHYLTPRPVTPHESTSPPRRMLQLRCKLDAENIQNSGDLHALLTGNEGLCGGRASFNWRHFERVPTLDLFLYCHFFFSFLSTCLAFLWPFRNTFLFFQWTQSHKYA